MATKASVAKASRRHSVKQKHASQEPEAAASPQPKQQPGELELRSSALDSEPSLAERVQAEREQLFKAISIVECCKFASATLLYVDDSEYMVPAFDTSCDLLKTSARALERIASECEDLDTARTCHMAGSSAFVRGQGRAL